MAQKVTTGVYKGVTTTELDELAAETAASLTATHPDYALVRYSLLIFWRFVRLRVEIQAPSRNHRIGGRARQSHNVFSSCLQLAARIAVSNLHKNTLKSFSET